MTEYELNAFHSEFDPVQAAESLQKDSSREAKIKVFAVLKTSYFLGFTRGEGRIGIINDKKGSAFVALFTNREELDKWPFERLAVTELPFEDARRLVQNNARLDGIVINPFGRAMFLRRPQLADIELTMQSARTGPREIKLKATLDYPVGVPAVVRELMLAHPEVYRVWLVAAHSQGEHLDHKLFVVDLDGKPDQLFPQLAEVIRPYMRAGEQVEMMKADINLLRAVEQAAKPLYVKPEER